MHSIQNGITPSHRVRPQTQHEAVISRHYLSAGEFVVNAGAVRGNRALLEALNSGSALRFASGGIVGSPPALSSPPAFSGVGGPNVSIHSPIAINASGGTPAQNQDLAKQMQAGLEQSMRNTVVNEIAAQMRSGNLLSSSYARQ
jgi:hypothetical protein